MASAIKTDFGYGGANLETSATGTPTLASALRDAADDITELRTQFVALLAKLDDDGGVTDEDYESTLTPADQALTKG